MKWMILLRSLRIGRKGINVIEGIRRLNLGKDLILNRDRKKNKRIVRNRVVLAKKSGRIFLFKILIYDFFQNFTN